MTVARGPDWPDGPAPNVGLHVLAYVCRAAYALGNLPDSKVLDATPVESKQHDNRWRLTVVRLGDTTNHRCDSYDHVARHWSCWHYTPHRR